eukprot:3029254-Pleurochrysis_carterae.AAC.2
MSGVDVSERALEAAREHARRSGVRDKTVFTAGSAYDLSAFDDASFDGVVLADVRAALPTGRHFPFPGIE